jgi:hypothetical protein
MATAQHTTEADEWDRYTAKANGITLDQLRHLRQTQVVPTAFAGNAGGALLDQISALADGATGDDLLQAVKLWCASCSTQGPPRAKAKTYAQMTGPERAQLKRTDAEAFKTARDAWLAEQRPKRRGRA